MKKYLLLLLLSGLFSQNLPQPVIVGQDVSYPTLKISNFVKINEKVGIEDDRVKLGIRQLMEEAFSNSRYVLVDDDNADFVASAELVYVWQPNQAFSILGIFNRRNTNTQVNIEISMIDNKNNKTTLQLRKAILVLKNGDKNQSQTIVDNILKEENLGSNHKKVAEEIYGKLTG